MAVLLNNLIEMAIFDGSVWKKNAALRSRKKMHPFDSIFFQERSALRSGKNAPQKADFGLENGHVPGYGWVKSEKCE